MRRALLILPLLLGAAAPAPVRPVVLELFTSQSCSSCPPADALLAALAATRDDVLPLDFHVDYWDYLQWRDRFSSRAATQRQRQYSVLLGSEVYTPQLVVDGQLQAVGSQRDAVLAAIASARAALRPGPALSLAAAGDGLVVDIGAGTGSGEVVLLGFDPQHVTQVAAGENAGRTLREVNVVRSITPLGHWTGAVLHTIAGRAEGDRHAVLLQAADGRILAAAVL